MSSQKKYLDLLEKIILNKVNPENGARIKFLVNEAVNGAPGAWTYSSIIAQLVSLHRTHELSRAALESLELVKGGDWWTNTLGFPFSMVGAARLKNVRDCAETVIKEGIPGAMIETGVWRGGPAS